VRPERVNKWPNSMTHMMMMMMIFMKFAVVTYWPIWVKLGIGELHIMAVSSCEVREDRTLKHLLIDFHEIRYKRSAHNAVEHV